MIETQCRQERLLWLAVDIGTNEPCKCFLFVHCQWLNRSRKFPARQVHDRHMGHDFFLPAEAKELVKIFSRQFPVCWLQGEQERMNMFLLDHLPSREIWHLL